MKKHWYNNGTENGVFENGAQPQGWVKGRLFHKVTQRTIDSQNKVDNFISQISNMDEFIDYCKTHSITEVAKQHQISTSLLKNVFRKIEFTKSVEDIERTRKLTKLKNHGDENFVNVQKSKATRLKRYGNENYVNIDKQNKTMLQRYGTTSYNNMDKHIETCMTKYGVDNASKAEEVKEKIKQVKQEKYGNPYYVNSEQAKQTNLKRYGVTCTLHTEENKKATKDTWLKKYGAEYPQQSQEVKDKIKATKLAKGSFKTAAKKCRETCLKRYGVTNAYALAKYTNKNKVNEYFANLLKENNIPYDEEYVIKKETGSYFRYDFKVNNTLIEINPFSTHNSTWSPFDNPVDKMYHANKTQTATQNGFRCIHVWDWDNEDTIIKLLQERNTIGARECIIKEVSAQEAKTFIDDNHIQGYAKDGVRISLQKDGKIISIMTFGKPRYNKKYQWELIRYCSTHNVVGGANKLLNYFVKTYTPNSIISYCDNSKFNGNTYLNLNFILKSKGTPARHWYNPMTKRHITDNLLRQRGFDQLFNTNFGKGTSNEGLMLQHSFVEIYDCGQSTYIWTRT